jgi:hypothetical protein
MTVTKKQNLVVPVARQSKEIGRTDSELAVKKLLLENTPLSPLRFHCV